MSGPGKKEIRGRVTLDPAQNAKDGDALTFQPIRVALLREDTTVFMENINAFDGTVLTFNFADRNDHFLDGSAVLIGPGIAITAKHVIEPHWDRLVSGERHSMCVGVAKRGMNIWAVRKVTLLTDLDIAILGLVLMSELPPDRTFRQTVISTRLPRVGDRVQIVGFRANDASRSIDPEHGYGADLGLLVSAGVVRERYPQGRDRAMLPWPVLEVSCPSWGGMSGGPVFDAYGHLIGLLCSSFSVDDGDGVSYVSLLWPALTVKFEGGWPELAFPGSHSLIELAAICKIERPEAVTHTLDEASGKVTTHYTPWE